MAFLFLPLICNALHVSLFCSHCVHDLYYVLRRNRYVGIVLILTVAAIALNVNIAL